MDAKDNDAPAPETDEFCNTIQVPEQVQVLGPDAALILTAGVAVVFSNEAEIGPDGVLEVTLDPSLALPGRERP